MLWIVLVNIWLFHDGGPYHIETSPLICSPNQWTGFYMIGTSVMKKCIVQNHNRNTRSAFKIYSKTTKTPEHVSVIVLLPLMLTLKRFHTLFWCFHCLLWISKCHLRFSVVSSTYVSFHTMGKCKIYLN